MKQWSWAELQREKQKFLSESLAPNTRKTYGAGIKLYQIFCFQLSISCLPLNEQVMENFCTSLSNRVGHKTIKVYLSGIQVFSVIQGYTEKIKDMLRLPCVLRGIEGALGSAQYRPPRTPVTLTHLQFIVRHVTLNPNRFNRYMFTAAVLLAFFRLVASVRIHGSKQTTV